MTRKEDYRVNHLQAPDPDPGRVESALEAWSTALAEKVLKAGSDPEPGHQARHPVGDG